MPEQPPRARRLAESNIEEEEEYSCQKNGNQEKEKWSGHRDLNSGPLVPQTSALPSCAMARHKGKAGELGELWIRFQMLFSESWIYLS